MNNKLNLEEIKLLLPDYITGSLSESENKKVEGAIAASSSLKEIYQQMREALDFARSIQADEPSPQYWVNLLPRIHERLEAKEKNNPASYIWKILVPVAAVVLIFIIYRISYNPETEISKNEVIKNYNEKLVTKDTTEKKIEKTPTPVRNEENLAEDKQATEKRHYIKRKYKEKDEDNLANKNNENKENRDNIRKEFIDNDLESVADVDDYAIFGAGVPGSIDDETDNELDKLNDNEQNDLLETLSNSNL